MESALFNTIVSLVAVIGLMMIIMVLFKKFFMGGLRGRQSQITIDVLGHRMLQPKRSVYILKVMGSLVVVGVTEAGMQPLMELRESNAPPVPESAQPHAPHSDDMTSKVRREFPDYLQESLHAMARSFRGVRKNSTRSNNDSGSVIWGTNFTL